DWLTRYGYLPPPDPFTAQQQTLEGLRQAVKEMQKIAGLPQTGELDDSTVRMMNRPRCSLPDIISRPGGRLRRRIKRYALTGTVWEKKSLTWKLESFPSSVSRDNTRSLVSLALGVWSRETQLNFMETMEEADIRVGFVGGSHGDGYPFDGPGGTLGHAFFPGVGSNAGATHMDADESWTYNDDRGTDLFAVIVHEFGHSLGLYHSSNNNSIMRPYYQGTVGDPVRYRLPLDDVEGIQVLYGLPNHGSGPPAVIPTRRIIPPYGPSPGPRLPFPDRCSSNFDAVANIRGEVFFFKNRYFWRMQSSKQLVSLSPAHISRFWLGIPSDLGRLDAVYERTNDSKIVFFAGNSYWVSKDTLIEPGYPRPLSDFGLNTDMVDAAFVWKHNGKTYFFRKNLFWRYDEKNGRMDPGYPKDSSLWQGVPPDIDDIISWDNGDTYFFKGSQYWKFQGGNIDADPGYPRSTALHWMYCPSESPVVPTEAPEGRGQRDCSCTCTGGRNSAVRNGILEVAWLALAFHLAVSGVLT
ncbi:hypothetical protein GDO86_017671, partial [Hymenochirus boettgeri]